MKAIHFFLLMLSFTLVLDCSKDADDVIIALPQPVTWNLTNVTGGFAGIDQNTPSGLITWTFNSNTQILTVVNTNTDDTIVDFYESGTYPYNIQDTGAENILTIEDFEFGNITETENTIVIDQNIGADGFILTFTR